MHGEEIKSREDTYVTVGTGKMDGEGCGQEEVCNRTLLTKDFLIMEG